MTISEENYLKVIYHLTIASKEGVTTNAIAQKMQTKASSVTDMLKKLSDKKWVIYQKYQGVSLTNEGLFEAKMIVRKHRLWEVFLVDKLKFSWDEVHEIAEELEHIQSNVLINKLEEFLGFPEKDPHGDYIPDKEGNISKIKRHLLCELDKNQTGICVGVKDSSSDFLKYLDKHNIALGSTIKVVEKELFDESMTIEIGGNIFYVSNKIASNLYINMN